jgi:hypothetical protein
MLLTPAVVLDGRPAMIRQNRIQAGNCGQMRAENMYVGGGGSGAVLILLLSPLGSSVVAGGGSA